MISSTLNQQQDKLHQIMKDIHSIIESKTMNDFEKEMKLRKIFDKIKMKDQDELREIFNFEAYIIIHKYINDCRTGIEMIFLDIIELVAKRGVQKPNMFGQHDPIFNNFENSGLLIKIEQIIADKNENENENEEQKYLLEIEQLIRIYIQIMKGRKLDQQMIDIFVKVIDMNIINLLNSINKLKENCKEYKNEQGIEETEREIQQSEQLIRVISFTGEVKKPFYDIYFRESIIEIMKKRILPLIHLNCPTSINCQQCINKSQSPALIELKSAIFQCIAEIPFYIYGFQQMLVNNYNIIPHLTPFVISFAYQSQFDKEIKIFEQLNQQLQETTSSLPFITSSLNLISNLFNNNSICKEMIQTPNLLHSLYSLTNYKHDVHINSEQDCQTQSIRRSSILCLDSIQLYGDEQDHIKLLTIGYGRVKYISISTAGGNDEQNDQEIQQELDSISWFLKKLHQGNNRQMYSLIPQFLPQPLLVKMSEEQIEEEGGSEEAEAQLWNKNIDFEANEVKSKMLNFFIHPYTKKPIWYW